MEAVLFWQTLRQHPELLVADQSNTTASCGALYQVRLGALAG